MKEGLGLGTKYKSGREGMTKYQIGRRKFVASAATVSAAIALGIKPGNILAQEGEILKVRMEGDIQVLDPGYMIGGAETTVQFATLPRLAVPVQDKQRHLGLGAVGLRGRHQADRRSAATSPSS